MIVYDLFRNYGGIPMVLHPVILGSKLIVLIILIVVLLILRGMLAPEDFRVAVIVGAAVFAVFTVAIWVVFLKLLSNPESKVSKQMVLSHQARAEDGFQSSADEFASLVGSRGVTLSALRPSGIGEFEGKRVPVVTEGGFVPADATVEVVSARGSRVIVRIVAEPDNEDQGGKDS